MDSKGLTTWQVQQLFDYVQRHLHYLDRLEGRMHQKHFPSNDPLHEAVKRARAAVNELSIQLNYLLNVD